MPAPVIGEAALNIRAVSTQTKSDIDKIVKGWQTKGANPTITPKIDTTSMQGQLNNATKQIRSWSDGLKQTALGGLTTLAGVIGGFLATSLYKGWQRITTIQDATASLTVALGSAAKAAGLLNDVLGVVRGTPFNLDQFAFAASQMVSFGVEAQKIPGYLTAIGEAAATRGSQANEYAQRLSVVFGQVSAIGKLSSDAIWSLSNVGVNALQILGNSFGKTTQEMQKMISNGAVPADKALDALSKGILEGSDGINGSTVALAGTMAKLRQTMTGAIGGFGAATARFGAAIIDPLKEGITELFTAGSTILDKLSGRFKGAFAEMMGSSSVKAFIAWIKDSPNQIDPFLEKLSQFKEVLAPLGAALGALAFGNLKNVLGPLGALLPSISPLVAGLGALVAMSPELQEMFGGMLDSFKELLPSLISTAETLAYMATTIIGSLMPAIKVLVSALSGLAGFFAENANAVRVLATVLTTLFVISKINSMITAFQVGLSGTATAATVAGSRVTQFGASVANMQAKLAGASKGMLAAKVGAGALAAALGIVAAKTEGTGSQIAAVGASAAAGFAVGGPWGAAIGAGLGLFSSLLQDSADRAKELADQAKAVTSAWKEAADAQLEFSIRGQSPGEIEASTLDIQKKRLEDLVGPLEKAGEALAIYNMTVKDFSAVQQAGVAATAEQIARFKNTYDYLRAKNSELPTINAAFGTPDFDAQIKAFEDVLKGEYSNKLKLGVSVALSVNPNTFDGQNIDTDEEIQKALDALKKQIQFDVDASSQPYVDASKVARDYLNSFVTGIRKESGPAAGRTKEAVAKLLQDILPKAPHDLPGSVGSGEPSWWSNAIGTLDIAALRDQLLASESLTTTFKDLTGVEVTAATTAGDLAAAFASLSTSVAAAATSPWGVLISKLTGFVDAAKTLKENVEGDPLTRILGARNTALENNLKIQQQVLAASKIALGNDKDLYSAALDYKETVENTFLANRALGDSTTEATEKAKAQVTEFLNVVKAAGWAAETIDAFAQSLGLTPEAIALVPQLQEIKTQLDGIAAARAGLGAAGAPGGGSTAGLMGAYTALASQEAVLIDEQTRLQESFNLIDSSVMELSNSGAWSAFWQKLADTTTTVANFRASMETSPLNVALKANTDALTADLAVQEQLVAIGAIKVGQDADLYRGAIQFKEAVTAQTYANMANNVSMGQSVAIAQAQAQAFIDTAINAGFSKDEVMQLAQTLGLLPESVVVDIRITGIQQAIAEMDIFLASLAAAGLAPGNRRSLDRERADLQSQLSAAKYAATSQLGGTYTVRPNAPSGGGGGGGSAAAAADNSAAELAEALRNATDALRQAILDLAASVKEYAEKLMGDIRERTQFDKAYSVSRLLGNLGRRTSLITEFASGIQTLRGNGLSQDAIDRLGLTGPESVRQIRKLLRATPDEIAQLNAALSGQRQEALNVAAREEGKVIAEAITKALTDFFDATGTTVGGVKTPSGNADGAIIGELTLQVQNQISDPEALALAIANAIAAKIKR